MKTLSRFVTKFTSLIVAVLSCLTASSSRVTCPSPTGRALEDFVDRVLKCAGPTSWTLAPGALRPSRRHAQSGGRGGRRQLPRIAPGSLRKDELVDDRILRQRSDLVEGLVCAFCCTWRPAPPSGWPPAPERPQPRQRRAATTRASTIYFLDPQLDLIHVRLQTWLPFTIQVYVNGHSWLAQEMLRRRLGFNLRDNAFALDDPRAARSWPTRSPSSSGPRSSIAWLAG